MLRWSDGDGQIVEGDAEPVASLDVGGDVTVAAAQILHKCVTGGEDPRLPVSTRSANVTVPGRASPVPVR